MKSTSSSRTRGWLLLLPIALLAAACGGGKLAQLKSQASVDMKCPVEQVQREEVQQYVERVVGCNKENVYAYDHSGEKWVSPLDRAAFDLSCPKDQIVTNKLDNRSVGASGCGKKTVYVLTQTIVPRPFGLVLQNSWVANGVSDDAKPPAAK
jgi:hypothetical protein